MRREAKGSYLLIGPGRWGSSDPWLGIPVKWPHISASQVIVEAGLDNFQVDPSQGTHFFQNLTSLGVSYLTINAFRGDGIYRQEVLDQPARRARDGARPPCPPASTHDHQSRWLQKGSRGDAFITFIHNS